MASEPEIPQSYNAYREQVEARALDRYGITDLTQHTVAILTGHARNIPVATLVTDLSIHCNWQPVVSRLDSQLRRDAEMLADLSAAYFDDSEEYAIAHQIPPAQDVREMPGFAPEQVEAWRQMPPEQFLDSMRQQDLKGLEEGQLGHLLFILDERVRSMLSETITGLQQVSQHINEVSELCQTIHTELDERDWTRQKPARTPGI